MMSSSAIGQLTVSWAMCPRWATRQSAESVQLVEGMAGNLSLSMVDVQGSGSTGGRRLAIDLQSFLRHQLSSGINAETAIRATNQHLVALRAGRVSAAIHIADLSPDHEQLIVCGYGLINLAVRSSNGWTTSQVEEGLAGRHFDARPVSETVAMPMSTTVVLANDGFSVSLDQFTRFVSVVETGSADASHADALLSAMIAEDCGRARSDKSVAVFKREQRTNLDRRQTADFAFPTNDVAVDR